MDKANYIRTLIILLTILFATSNHLAAAEISTSYEEYQETIIYKPACDPVKGINTEGCFYQAPKKTNLAKDPYWNQCVYYAKTITGVYGTWGNGGRYLSDNSGAVVGAVVIFDNTHVGVIIKSDGYNFAYTDRNGLGDRQIREEVWTNIDDPTIWKYHKF